MTHFYKLSGSGNDFLALADPATPAGVPESAEIRAWCRRGVSLGADGLFVLRRSPAGSGKATMEYWNADGLPADLCLNGTRCAAQLAFHLGWASERVEIATAAGTIAARRLDGERVALELPAPAAPPRAVALTLEGIEGRTWNAWAITIGVPHLVVLWPESLAAAPVVSLGRPLRGHPALGPAGANVDFVRFPTRERMEIRTYERGVEDETLSCGTGILAGAAVGLHLGLATLPLAVLTQGGFELAVDPPWSLAGDARLVAAGNLLPAAARQAAPPAWS